MTPYEQTFYETTVGANAIVALDYPGRCEITKITAVNLSGSGNTDITFYSRAFTSDPIILAGIMEAPTNEGNAQLVLAAPFAFAVGDVVAVTGTSVGAYNASHRVIERIDDYNYVTDKSYSIDFRGNKTASATLAIPSAEQPLYKVASISGATPQENTTRVVYHNRDPLPNNNIGVKRKIYAKIADAQSYRIRILCEIRVAEGG